MSKRGLWLILLLAVPMADQGQSQVAVVHDELSPTQGELKRRLDRELSGISVSSSAWNEIPEGVRVVVVLSGPTTTRRVIASGHRGRVIGVRGWAGPGVPGAMELRVAPSGAALAKALMVLLPGRRRVAVVSAFPDALSAVRPMECVLAVRPQDLSASAAVRRAQEAGAELILLPDEPGMVSRAKGLLAAGSAAQLPVVTTAPWIARSGAPVGVVPDLAAAAFVLARLVRDERSVPLAPPALVRTMVPDSLGAIGLAPDLAAMGSADRILRLGPGVGR